MQKQSMSKKAPKQCRYKEKCRRQTSCLYYHEGSDNDTKGKNKEVETAEVKKLLLEVETIKEENKQKLHDIKTL